MNETEQNIMDVAERMIREGGYHSFSFRQIADELAIKSASIHYYFPSKEDLGVAVAKRYTKCFIDGLGNPLDKVDAIGEYIEAFQASLKIHQRACLCGVLAAESGKLPSSILGVLSDFEEANRNWLAQAVKKRQPHWSVQRQNDISTVIFSSLEGAMIFAALIQQPEYLEKIGCSLRNIVSDNS